MVVRRWERWPIFRTININISFHHKNEKVLPALPTGVTYLDSGSNWRERRRIIVVIDFYRLRTADEYFNNTLPTCNVIFHAVQLARCT